MKKTYAKKIIAIICLLAIIVISVTYGISGGIQEPDPTPSPATESEFTEDISDISTYTPDEPEPIEAPIPKAEDFYVSEISDELFDYIWGNSYKEDCTVPREDLRYLHVLHKDFEGDAKEGEVICNKSIAEDLLSIFEELYEIDYPIEKIRLIDEYNADDTASMEDNNTSCFNFRLITGSTNISKHGLGLAIDINPLYNPYVKEKDGSLIIEPPSAVPYSNRSTDFPHKITESDPAYQIFSAHGFTWGGTWSSLKDYQHFER